MGEACFGGWSIDHGPQIWTPGEGRANAAGLGLISRPPWLAAGASLAAQPHCLPRVSWLVGWLAEVLYAEFLSREGEELPATPHTTLSTLSRHCCGENSFYSFLCIWA